MLLGRFLHTIDSKGRLSIPMKSAAAAVSFSAMAQWTAPVPIRRFRSASAARVYPRFDKGNASGQCPVSSRFAIFAGSGAGAAGRAGVWADARESAANRTMG